MSKLECVNHRGSTTYDRIWENLPDRRSGQKLNSCQKRHLLSLSIACAKCESCSQLHFNATNISSRSLAIITFLMFWRKRVPSPLLGGA